MLTRVAEYMPGYGLFFGSSNEKESLGQLIDFKKHRYDPANKEHCDHLQAKIKCCNKAYKNLYQADMWNFVAPVGGSLLLLLATGTGFFGCLVLLVVAVYTAYYFIGGQFQKHKQLRENFDNQLNALLEVHESLVTQFALDLKHRRQAAKEKEIDLEKVDKIDILQEDQGNNISITAIVDDNYILPFGKKKIEIDVEEAGRKIKKTVIVDDAIILNLIQSIAPYIESQTFVTPYLRNGIDQHDISPEVLKLMSSPPHNILFCPHPLELSNQSNVLTGPANSITSLTGNYAAHTKFYFYGQGVRPLFPSIKPSLVDNAANFIAEVAQTSMQKKVLGS